MRYISAVRRCVQTVMRSQWVLRILLQHLHHRCHLQHRQQHRRLLQLLLHLLLLLLHQYLQYVVLVLLRTEMMVARVILLRNHRRKRTPVLSSSSRLSLQYWLVESCIISTTMPIATRRWKLMSMRCKAATRWCFRVISIPTRMPMKHIAIPLWLILIC